MNEKLQLFLTLDQRTQLYMDVDMPYLYEDAYLEPGTYPIDSVTDGYAHILSEGLIKCTPEVLITCPYYINGFYGYCHWHSDCMNPCCFETCIFKLVSDMVTIEF